MLLCDELSHGKEPQSVNLGESWVCRCGALQNRRDGRLQEWSEGGVDWGGAPVRSL